MSRLSDAELREELERIRDANEGRLTADAVLADASEGDSKIGGMLPEDFWDDAICSRKYRINYFRRMIATVKIVSTEGNRTVSSVCFVRDPQAPAEQQGYVSVVQMRSDPDLGRAALFNEFSRVMSLLERAYALAEALNLQSEVAELRSRVESLRMRVAPRQEGLQ